MVKNKERGCEENIMREPITLYVCLKLKIIINISVAEH